jgi:hypothetical protein
MPPPPGHTRWKPGQSGNPAGRPKAKPLTDAAVRLLRRKTLGGKPVPGGKTVLEALVLVWIREALKGDMNALRQLLERVEGRVPTPIAVKEEPGEDKVVNVYIVGDDDTPTLSQPPWAETASATET